jgi:HNH endonuclease
MVKWKMESFTSVKDPTMADTFICIYCKLTKPSDQRSKEHLLQRSLGGDLTAQFVCKACNGGFSKIDQALSDRSTVTLSRVAYTPRTAHGVKAGGTTTYYDNDRDLFIEVELRNQLTPVVMPQLHLRPTGQGQLIALDREAAEQVIEFVAHHFESGTMESVHRFHGLPNGVQTNTAALVVRKPGDGYVRLPARGDENWYFPMLKTAWREGLADGLAKATPISKQGEFPEVRLDFKLAPNDVFRAIAKIAFNVLAFKRGSNLVLRPEFDPIREYINGDGLLPQNLESGDIAVDRRFVSEIPEDQQQISFIDDGHAVVFCYLRPELIALVTLYGSHVFLVRFPALGYDEQEELFGHRFSIDRSGNDPLDLNKIVERILQKYSDRLGLTPEQAAKMLEILPSQKSEE